MVDGEAYRISVDQTNFEIIIIVAIKFYQEKLPRCACMSQIRERAAHSAPVVCPSNSAHNKMPESEHHIPWPTRCRVHFAHVAFMCCTHIEFIWNGNGYNVEIGCNWFSLYSPFVCVCGGYSVLIELYCTIVRIVCGRSRLICLPNVIGLQMAQPMNSNKYFVIVYCRSRQIFR